MLTVLLRQEKPFTICDELILPSIKEIYRELLGKAAVKKIEHLLLWANTMTKRIEEIAEDVETQFLDQLLHRGDTNISAPLLTDLKR